MMRIRDTRPAPRPRRWLIGLTSIASVFALVSVGAAPAPAQAARPSKAGIVWMTQQALRTGPTVSERVEWPAVRGATSYEVDLAPSSGAITGTEVQGSSRKKTVKVRARSGSRQYVVVNGLKPATSYCFQLRGRNAAGFGSRGGVHCKVTMRANRGVPASGVPMVVGTYNTCSVACSTLRPWSERKALVLDRIRAMNVGSSGRKVDVLAVEEGGNARAFLQSSLDGTFSQGCQSANGLQSLFVRDATYSVVDATSGSLTFGDDRTHGGCWVTVHEEVTGAEYVVVAVHLWATDGNGATDDDAIRATQLAKLVAAVEETNPGLPVIYAGDFNSNRSRPSDAPLRTLATHGSDDAYDQAAAYRSLPYCNSASGSTGAIRTSWTWGDHVDRVFAPPGAHVASWEVDYRRASSTTYVTPLASDHNPVLVELRIPATP